MNSTMYPTHDLELAVVVFALKSWRHFLYGSNVSCIWILRVSNTSLLINN
jgi:hypothetical protein